MLKSSRSVSATWLKLDAFICNFIIRLMVKGEIENENDRGGNELYKLMNINYNSKLLNYSFTELTVMDVLKFPLH